MTIFSRITPVDEFTRLVDPESAVRMIATVDRDLAPCTKAQAAGFVAELLLCYPAARPSDDGESIRDMEGYAAKLFEAFRSYPATIGKAAVHGGTGIPARLRYKPQPSDIVEFCEREKDKLLTVKTMAQRHLGESIRREEQRGTDALHDKSRKSPEERRRMVEEAVRSFKAMPIEEALV